MAYTKGSLTPRYIQGATDWDLDFQFNPTTISERHGVRYHFPDAQGQYLPISQFGQKEPIELSFELFFYNNKGVNESLKRLRRTVSPRIYNSITTYEQSAPPVYMLQLGEIGVFEGVVEDITINIDKYKPQGLEPQSIRAQIRFKVTSGESDLGFYTQQTGVN